MSFLSNADPLFGMAPSISTDGKWVAAIVEEADVEIESFMDQRFVVKRVSTDALEMSFPLSTAYTDDYFEALNKGRVPAEMVVEYQARADRANRWLARSTWRGLSRCEQPEGTCTATYFEPHLVVKGPSGTLFDAVKPSWAGPPDMRALGDTVFCDAESNVMLIEIIFLRQGHLGVSPFPEIHAVQLNAPGGCSANAAATTSTGSSTPP